MSANQDFSGVDEILEGAREARSDYVASREAVEKALALAPEDMRARMGAYKFYLYNHRLDQAALHAEWLLGRFGDDLGVSRDWRAVAPESAAFSSLDSAPRRYLQALIALGYCRARCGDLAGGRELLAKAERLDPGDRFGAGRLLAVLDRPGGADEDE
jgi:hypothetical protein